MTTAPHRRRAPALRAARRRHDRASSGHAVSAQEAVALADALLGAVWLRPALLRVAWMVFGRRAAWVRPVVDAVWQAYREAPTDRPRELADFIGALSPDPDTDPVAELKGWSRTGAAGPGRRLRRAGASAGQAAELARFIAIVERRTGRRRAVIRRRLVVPVRTVRMRWPAPPIDDLAALADFLDLDGDQLDWFADRREINRHARDERLRHYRYLWLPHRLIEAPKHRLRAIQRLLLDRVLARIPVHERAHGFVPGRGVHTFAASHAGRAVVVSMDLRAFFSSITASRVYAIFRQAGYPEPVAHTLTALTTTRTPARTLRKAPDAHRAALLRRPHLPQGAPTSPALANLCAYRLDRRLTGLADRFGLHYSRYADDLAFSGHLSPRRTGVLIAAVREIAAEEGFRAHPDKTRVRHQSDRQLLAGLVVNNRPAVPREEYDTLRAILHNAARDGLAAANRDGHLDFAAHLAGRVAWQAHRHPTRATKLQALLQAALSA